MATTYLDVFLEKSGYAVHEINTIIVGLSSIEDQTFTKPSNLTISWSTNDPKASARKARQFALKSAIIFIDDALAVYLKGIKDCVDDSILASILSRKNPFYNEDLKNEINIDLRKLLKKLEERKNGKEKDKKYIDLDSADRIRCLPYFFQFPNNYWIPTVILLICWRNRIAHSTSMSQLTQVEVEILKEYAEEISSKYAKIDIGLTIRNFNAGIITLKDFTTFISMTINLVKFIDKSIVPKKGIKLIEEYLKSNEDKRKAFEKIMSHPDKKVKQRKFKSFLKTNMPHLLNTWEEHYPNN
jgi:hypothetical protein